MKRKKRIFQKKQRGVVSFLIVFVIGMAALFITLGFSELAVRQAQVTQNTAASNKALAAAHAGIEDALLHLRLSSNYGNPTNSLSSTNLNLDGAVFYATTTAISADERRVTSTGKFGGSVKTIEIEVENSEQGTGFLSAVQTGNGGFEMEQGTKICAGNGSTCTGNTTVYSNSNIWAARAPASDPTCSATTTSKIIGSATAVGSITKLGSGDTGPCITQDASASALLNCRVAGKRADKAGSSPPNCPGGTYTSIGQDPPVLPLPEFDEDYWRVQATNSAFGGSTFNGNCEIGGTPSQDCSSGGPNFRIGPKKIDGNLTIASNTHPEITGPIWVTGNISIGSNNNFDMDPAFVDIGTVIMADGDIDTNSNVQFPDVGLAIVLVVSTKDYSPGYSCSTPAIHIDSNVSSVIFYSLRGCVNIRVNALFYGAVVGQKVHLSSNSEFYYNGLFKDAVFGVSAGGGWLINSWRNID